MIHNHGDGKSPKDRVVGPLPNGLFMAYKTWIFCVPYHPLFSGLNFSDRDVNDHINLDIQSAVACAMFR